MLPKFHKEKLFLLAEICFPAFTFGHVSHTSSLIYMQFIMHADDNTIAGLAKPRFKPGPREIRLVYVLIMQIKPSLDMVYKKLVKAVIQS